MTSFSCLVVTLNNENNLRLHLGVDHLSSKSSSRSPTTRPLVSPSVIEVDPDKYEEFLHNNGILSSSKSRMNTFCKARRVGTNFTTAGRMNSFTSITD